MDPSWYLVIFVALGAFGFFLYLRRTLKQLERATREREALEGEEARMFDFLHVLGSAIERDRSTGRLHKVIVDGVEEVVGADGGALYLLSDDRQFLVPRYISEDCPPLVGVPVEVARKAKRDPRAMESHLRLAKVPVEEGILGHALRAGEPILVPDVKNHDAFRDAFLRYEGDVTALIAPLKHGGKDIGVLAVAEKIKNDEPFTQNKFVVFKSMAEQSSFALGNAIIHAEAQEKRKLEDELHTAREVQRVLLPQEDPVVPGYRIAGTNIPARIISGDYYDYIDLNEGRFGVAIADVSGKGVPAGLLMAMCRSALRSVARNDPSPSAALGSVNRQLFPDIREDMFISMAYAILEGDGGRVVMSRAGHDPALLYRKADGSVTAIKSPGLAVGIDEGDVFERVTKDHVLEMHAGDCLLFHTDGVREAMDTSEEEFGLDRMTRAFAEGAMYGASSAIDSVQRALRSFAGTAPQMDDITLIAVEKR